MTQPPWYGRRILAIGEALAPLGKGPLFGSAMEIAGPERLQSGPVFADLVLIDADAAAPEALASAIAALAASPSPPPALLMGAHLPAALVRALMRLERSDVLEPPFTGEQLTSAVEALISAGAAAPARAPRGARCWAVTGAVGGAGATTLAVELASMLAERSARPRSVCLVDLNLADGAAAAYLGASAAMPLGDFAGSADRIDAGMIAAFAVGVTKQLDLLACPRDALGFDRAPADVVLRVLEVACEIYDWVVLDVPRHRRPWTLEVLGGCDEVLIISELTVPALLAARSLAEEMERDLQPGARPRIVLNRLASRMFGPAPSMAEAERALQRKADAGVSSDWEAAAASANLGGPVATHRPKSKIVRDVSALLDRLVRDGAADVARVA